MSKAPRIVVPARRYRPAAFEAKACSAQVLMFGAIKPPTAPIEFTRAIPPAAAAPARELVGNVQKIGCTAMNPAAAKHRAISEMAGDVVATEPAKPAPAA